MAPVSELVGRNGAPRVGAVGAVIAVAAMLLALGPLASGTAGRMRSRLHCWRSPRGRPGIVEVTWKIPLLRLTGAELRPVLPADCPVTNREVISEDSESVTTRWSVDCGATGLIGKRVGVEGLAAAKTDALLRLELADGRAIDTVLRAREPSLIVPAREERVWLASRYVALGIEHILTGYDHLLFVFGLLLLAAGTRALIATITAFTLGHSVTLTLAVLDVARVPSAPVEVLIAFSIFVLAVELARADPSGGRR